ncbi:hypothetical protein [Streptomyces sp. NPDC002851]
MTWWLKARRVHTLLPFGFLAFAVLAALVQDGQSPLPAFSVSGRASGELMLFVPLALTAVLFNCLHSRCAAAEDSGIRAVRVYDALLALGVVALTVPVTAALVELTGSRSAASLDRNTAFLVGLTLLCGVLMGSSALLMPALWPTVVSMFGFRGPSDPYPWTVLPEQPHTWYATVGAALMLAVGIGAHLFVPRRSA